VDLQEWEADPRDFDSHENCLPEYPGYVRDLMSESLENPQIFCWIQDGEKCT